MSHPEHAHPAAARCRPRIDRGRRVRRIPRAGALGWPLWALLAVLGAGLARATPESGSLIATPDGALLLSANLDAGSVSKLDARSGERLAELRLGGDIRRIALSADGRALLASDYASDRVHLIDVATFALQRSTAVGARPFGVVYDAESDRFWVSLFEAAELVSVDRGGRVGARVATADTPRGLALTRDGRLLVTHAMLGEVSILDVRQQPPRRMRTIALGTTTNPDRFVSQGAPRLLDDIAISPDQREAWLPHVLWSFGHPFQFRSTVFPAISVLSLEPGAEHELADQRKELFRQIDIVDGEGKTRIVSNPHDVAFSADGSKAYVTLAASEDLAVFDRSRGAQEGAARRGRRRGKQSQGGAQAIQILRHLPGDAPSGLVVVGDAAFVQNASSLDVSRVERGGDGPFARARVSSDVFARPVGADPLPPRVRRGKRIFFGGNTDEFAQQPLAGDFWMSCGSCHLDGFNFTNRYLMRDARLSPASGPGWAAGGHRGLRTLVAGDFVGDYIRMVQDTQGGMGADDRVPTVPRVDPDRPPPEVAAMMGDLHAFVTAPQNLPYLSTWLRVEPRGARVAEDEWSNPAACAGCHPRVFEEWSTSNHRLMSTSHPYYRYLEDLAAAEVGEGFRAWCMGCHNPKQLSAGRANSHGPRKTGEAGGASLLLAEERGEQELDEGTDCLFCHRVASVQHAGGNASLTVNLEDRARYPFEQSPSRALRWFGERLIAARPAVHADSYRRDVYRDSRYCGSCHSEFAPGSGAVIHDTYAEWEASPFNAPGDPAVHRSCIDCHMHADARRIGEPIAGRSTARGRTKPNVRSHRFTGASHDLLAPRDAAAAEQSLALLETAARLEAELVPDGLRVRVHNVGAGHHLPTGVADLRQLWLQLRVTDAGGALLIESGAIDAAGDELPEGTRIFNKVLGDAAGQPVGLRFWRYATLLEDRRIPAGGHRDEVFALPGAPAFPLRVEVELRFRSFAPALTERVRADYPELPQPRPVTIARLSTELRESDVH